DQPAGLILKLLNGYFRLGLLPAIDFILDRVNKGSGIGPVFTDSFYIPGGGFRRDFTENEGTAQVAPTDTGHAAGGIQPRNRCSGFLIHHDTGNTMTTAQVSFRRP